MNELCVVLLIAVAGAIGRLWPRKHSPQPVPQPAPSPHEYGLFLPPDCDEVEFKDVLQYSTYHREYPKDKSYDFITIRNPANITVTFKKKTIGYRYPDTEIKGVVKSGN
jgi:hypothetical protein